MLRADRIARILDHVAAAGSADVHQLAALLGVSGATVRRDLQLLDEQGLLQRTHGGAVTGSLNLELPLRHRSGRHQEEKRRIALAAAALVPDGAVVGMTGGTTVTEVARALCEGRSAERGLTVVTNAVNIAADLIVRPEIRLLVVGGTARSASYALVGPATERMLTQYHLDVAFIGVDGLTATEGCTTYDEMEAATDLAFLRAATRSVVVTDSTKVGKVTFAGICPLADIDDLVTDDDLTEEQEQSLSDAGPRIIRA
jgi:DeoR family transcriptional regulator of aga operon